VDSVAVSGYHGALEWILCWFGLAALHCTSNTGRIFNLKRNAASAAIREYDACELCELQDSRTHWHQVVT